MESSLVNVPVALIFFNRPEVFSKVFECVRRNKPSQLFLIQDGPRSGRIDDEENIKKCREIVSSIDWECDVVKDYSDVNLGCGRRVFTGITNAFKCVDRLVIIEDDILFSDSFLPFCAELLERYKDDTRIDMISGMNQLGEYEACPYDYFFSSQGGAIWGWATWKRSWVDIEWGLDIVDDKYVMNTILANNYPRNFSKVLYDRASQLRSNIQKGVQPSFWSFHEGFYAVLNNKINIVPQKNMISNIGLTADSAHSTNNISNLPANTQKLYYATMHNVEFPIKHPKAILDDRFFKSLQEEMMYPTGLNRIKTIIDYRFRRLIMKMHNR